MLYLDMLVAAFKQQCRLLEVPYQRPFKRPMIRGLEGGVEAGDRRSTEIPPWRAP